MRTALCICLATFSLVFIGCGSTQEDVGVSPTPVLSEAPTPTSTQAAETESRAAAATDTVELSESEWRERLTPEQYRVLREEGTERAFSGEYHDHHASGVYTCAGCGAELYASETKFDSGTGWPSFFQPIADGRVRTDTDISMGMTRTEIECARCGGHLGHVFNDGPAPTGKRHCVNSVSLEFSAAE